MIAIIGGPSKEDEKGKKPGLSIGMKIKPKKVDGIGGEYSSDPDDEDDMGMDNEEKKIEAARPLARSMNAGQVTAKQIVDCFNALFELCETEPHEEDESEHDHSDLMQKGEE